MMFVMRFAIGLAKAAVLLIMVTMWFDSAAYAQTAREFGAKTPTVRLCPATCVAVNGHGMKAGGKTTVYETRNGWARVSGYLKRADLVKSFGNSITQKPALWVPVAQLKGSAKAEPAPKKKVAKKPAAKRISVVDRVARLRRVPLPKFRPGTTARTPAVPVAEEAPVVTETQPVSNEPVTEVATAETKPVEIIDSEPVVATPKGEGSRRALTWEELQAKLAEQQSKIKNRTVEETKAAEAARLAEEKRRREAEARRAADAAAQAKAAKIAADKEAAERTAKLAAEQEAARKAEEERLKKEEEARLAEAKKSEADKAAEARKAAEAAKAAEAEKARLAAAEAKKAADAAKVAALASQTAKVEGETKAEIGDGTVGYNPPKPEDSAPKSEEVAVVLPPKKVEEPEPVFKSATADPIAFGERPKTLTKALRDKRLNKLPGRKSKVRKDVVIALRHYALGLLNSGECEGIARGGPSSSPGMLYIACTDDPTYLRQFPLKEESW